MRKFIISTNNCADFYSDYFKGNDIYLINIKRILNDQVIEEVYNSDQESYAFYETLKNGALPTTTQINPYEYTKHFSEILSAEPKGDIIHVSLSSGLSGSCSNALLAAEMLNSELVGRKIYVVDSLSATIAMGMIVDYLVRYRNEGMETVDALSEIDYVIKHQQTFAILGDLFHLCRGGRINPVKATIGSLLRVKPIITINHKGKLAIMHSAKGKSKAISYLLKRMVVNNFSTDNKYSEVYIIHSSNKALAIELENELVTKYSNIRLTHGIVGSVIGTHLGPEAVGVIFIGGERETVE